MPLTHVILGSSAIVLSIVIGGVFGYYFPLLAKLLTILYAGLALYLPKVKYKTNIFVTGSVMFLIFTALPFTWQNGIHYALDGLLVAVIFVIFYRNNDTRIIGQSFFKISCCQIRCGRIAFMCQRACRFGITSSLSILKF